MSNQQCPCAELFKIGDDYTLEHHPDCLIANAEKFGQLIRESAEHLRGQLFKATTPPDEKPVWWGVESCEGFLSDTERDAAHRLCQRHVEIYSQAKPTTEFSATVTCRSCDYQYDVKQELPHGARSFHWACPQCELKTFIWFDKEAATADMKMSLTDFDAIEQLLESAGEFGCLYEDAHGNIVLESGER